MKVKLLLLILPFLFVSVAKSELAVLPNRKLIHFGEQGSLQGGSIVARVKDSSSAWYNPAGFVKETSDSFSGNTSIYGFTQHKEDGIDTSRSQVSLPSYMGMVKQLNKNWAWSFSIATPSNLELEKAWQSTRQYPTQGFKDVAYYTEEVGDFKILAPGLSLSHAVSNKFRIGFGLRVYILESETSLRQSYLSEDTGASDTFINKIIQQEVSVNQRSLRLNFGMQYEASPTLHFGLNLRSPTLEVNDSAKVELVEKTINSSFTDTTTQASANGETDIKLPLEATLGVAFLLERSEIELNVDYSAGTSGKAMTFQSPHILGYSRTDSGTPVFFTSGVEDDIPSPNYKLEPVTNFALSYSYRLKGKSSFQMGLWTDFSPVKDINNATNGFFSKADYFGMAVGLTTQLKNITTSFGLSYLTGSGEHNESDEITDGTTLVKFKNQSLSALLGGSYYF